MSKSAKQGKRDRFQRVRALRVQALLEGAHSNGLSGVIQTVYRMIDPDQPSVECLAQADVDFAGASSGEDVWDAANDMAACLLDARLEALVEPDPGDPPPPDPVPGKGSAGNLVLAALLVLLHDQAKK